MAYPFVAAKYFTPGGLREPRAVVVHMAEGGGTVSWLHNGPYRVEGGRRVAIDNSAHFVVEYSGRVVQLVRDADADHSLHVDLAHWTAPRCGYFSAEVARELLSDDGFRDPNAYLFAIECEGYAATGPNELQFVALRSLIADLRRRHPTLRGLLGHRDFQGYKACPGCHVFDKLHHGRWPADRPHGAEGKVSVAGGAFFRYSDPRTPLPGATFDTRASYAGRTFTAWSTGPLGGYYAGDKVRVVRVLSGAYEGWHIGLGSGTAIYRELPD